MSDMTLPVILEPNVFQIKLHVDPVDLDDEEDVPLTTRSWKAQLWRLLHKAPQPVPVFCKEPKCFPHLEDTRRISESSWTSDTTNSTNVTMSDSILMDTATNTDKGSVNENNAVEAISKANTSIKKTVHVSRQEKDNFAPGNENIPHKVEPESYKNASDSRGGKLSSCLPSCKNDKMIEIMQQDDEKPQPLNPGKDAGNRYAPSLSIHGDSEYWEKFRYSKDYHSSLMIETICNEVFNLKPGPRYNNLMILSETHGDNIESNEQEKESSLECNKEIDKKGIKVKVLETSRRVHSVTKRISGSVPAPSLQIPNEIQEEEIAMATKKVDDVITISERELYSKTNSQKDYEDTTSECDFNDGSDIGKVTKKHWGEREKSRNSTTSSVFTTTTMTSNEGVIESDRRQAERKLLLESFGQAYHGYLTKRETEKLLKCEGQYLIRQMWSEEGFVLSLMFDRGIWNYRLFYETKSAEPVDSGLPSMSGSCILFYLEDRRKYYKSLDDMVREGLITLHLDEHAGSYIDLLMELAQFQRNDSLLQTPTAMTSGSRKNSRSPSFKTRLSASVTGSGDEHISRGSGVALENETSSSTTSDSPSTDIALLIHYFEEEVFDGLAKCHACTSGIWGTSFKGLRCRDCRLTVHESCIDNVKTRCNPDLTMLSPFSSDLTSLVKGSLVNGRNESHGPPYILQTCINEVEVRGLTTEGIYRICGSLEEIEKLKSLFEQDKINTTLANHQVDIHAVTGLIKLFFRQLPDALITQEAFLEFVKEQSSGEMKIDTVQALVASLPPGHRITLKYLLQHLHRVASEKSSNKMTAYNLSSVLLPSLLVLNFDMIEIGTKLVHFLITHVQDIF